MYPADKVHFLSKPTFPNPGIRGCQAHRCRPPVACYQTAESPYFACRPVARPVVTSPESIPGAIIGTRNLSMRSYDSLYLRVVVELVYCAVLFINEVWSIRHSSKSRALHSYHLGSTYRKCKRQENLAKTLRPSSPFRLRLTRPAIIGQSLTMLCLVILRRMAPTIEMFVLYSSLNLVTTNLSLGRVAWNSCSHDEVPDRSWCFVDSDCF